jgi:hypothetical protein
MDEYLILKKHVSAIPVEINILEDQRKGVLTK